MEMMQEMKGAKTDETSWSYSNEPLTPEVLSFNISASFKLSKFTNNGAGDSEDHLVHYNNHMNILGASNVVKC